MRTLLCAIPALLALAGTALAEPQQLDEAQLGGIAAGNFSISSNQSSITSTANSTTNTVETNVGQILSGGAVNDTYSTAVGSTNVDAMGSAVTSVTGQIAP
jgi:hypothetical protein